MGCWDPREVLPWVAHRTNIVRSVTWVHEGVDQRQVLHSAGDAQRHQQALDVVVSHAATAAWVNEVLPGGWLHIAQDPERYWV